jgi:membrane-bound lytic murein transglycosylase D
VAHPEAFNAELPLIEDHPYFQSVEITRDIDVALIAKLADVDLKDFKELNPSVHQPVIFASGTPQILLPWDNAAVFRRNLDAYADGQYASWTAWTAPSTMTVAAAAERFGMSVADLRQLNNIPPRMLIKAGSALVVPRSAKVQQDVAVEVADNGRLALAPEIVTRRTTIKARKRDTVTTVAQRYRVTPADVATWNEVKSSTTFRSGEQLVVYLPVSVGKKASAAPAARRTGHAATAKKTAVSSQRPAAKAATKPAPKKHR